MAIFKASIPEKSSKGGKDEAETENPRIDQSARLPANDSKVRTGNSPNLCLLVCLSPAGCCFQERSGSRGTP